MNAFFSFPTDTRRRMCEVTGEKLGIDATSIEKDFWICWVLRELFSLRDVGEYLTFKGGTSLSKGWGIIKRFSEDVDVVINREYLGFGGDKSPETALSGKERERRLEQLKNACVNYIRRKLTPDLKDAVQKHLPKDAAFTISEDFSDPDCETLLFKYPAICKTGGAYLSQTVRIELGARSDTEPSDIPSITPYLADVLPNEMVDSKFSIRTVAKERTFWEKAMLLHEESFRDRPRSRLSRHYYDLHCLIVSGIGDNASADIELFNRVAAHRAVFFRQRQEIRDSLKKGSLKLVPPMNHIEQWRRDFKAMEAMFFGDPPTFDEIMRLVGKFEVEFNRS